MAKYLNLIEGEHFNNREKNVVYMLGRRYRSERKPKLVILRNIMDLMQK